MNIRDNFKAIPAVLQWQITWRGLTGCAFLLFSVVFLLMGYDALLVLPGVGFMLFSFASAVLAVSYSRPKAICDSGRDLHGGHEVHAVQAY